MAKVELDIVVRALDQASSVLRGIGTGIKGHEEELKKAGRTASLYGAVITGALGFGLNSVAQSGKELKESSDSIGVTVEVLSKLRFAAEQNGIADQALSMGLARLARGMYDASRGTGEQKQALDELGIQYVDANGKLLGMDKAVVQIADSLSKVDDPARRAGIAMLLFGRSGVQMLPLINEGSEGIERLMRRADEIGASWTDAEAVSAQAFARRTTELAQAIGELTKQVLLPFMDAAEPVVRQMAEYGGQLAVWTKAHPEAAKAIVTVLGALGVLLTVLGPILLVLPGLATAFSMVGSVVGGLGAVFAALGGPLTLILAAVAALAVAGYLVYRNWDRIKAWWSSFWPSAAKTAKEAAVSIVEFLFPPVAIITHWEEIGAAIKRTWGDAVQYVRDQWQALKDSLFPAGGLVGFFRREWEEVVAFFRGLWDSLRSQARQFKDDVVGTVRDAAKSIGIDIGGGSSPTPQLGAGALGDFIQKLIQSAPNQPLQTVPLSAAGAKPTSLSAAAGGPTVVTVRHELAADGPTVALLSANPQLRRSMVDAIRESNQVIRPTLVPGVTLGV